MHAGRRYSLKQFIVWTRRDIYLLIGFATIPTLLFQLADAQWLALPWVPIALIGTAAAFIVGFRNTQTYARLWEARQIWGSIVNASRSWGIMVTGFVGKLPESDTTIFIQRQLIYRHIAWLSAMRYQLREPKKWENIKGKPSNEEFLQSYQVDEWANKLEDALQPFLPAEEAVYVLGMKNRATHIIALQSKQLKQLSQDGLIDPLAYIEMENLLVNLFEQQGKSERIKNFPYPRQFATINQMFVRLFAGLIPFGMLNEFSKLGSWQVWLTIPFSAIVSWIFLAMEKVGESTENPFEGGANDVPITAMSRTIEIDLREMLGEKNIPPALNPVNNILM